MDETEAVAGVVQDSGDEGILAQENIPVDL